MISFFDFFSTTKRDSWSVIFPEKNRTKKEKCDFRKNVFFRKLKKEIALLSKACCLLLGFLNLRLTKSNKKKTKKQEVDKIETCCFPYKCVLQENCHCRKTTQLLLEPVAPLGFIDFPLWSRAQGRSSLLSSEKVITADQTISELIANEKSRINGNWPAMSCDPRTFQTITALLRGEDIIKAVAQRFPITSSDQAKKIFVWSEIL